MNEREIEVRRQLMASLNGRLADRNMAALNVLPDTWWLADTWRLADTGLDSLDVVEMSLELEDTLSIVIPQTEVSVGMTIGQLVGLLTGLPQNADETHA